MKQILVEDRIFFFFFSNNSFGHFELVQLFPAGVNFSQIKNMEQGQGTC